MGEAVLDQHPMWTVRRRKRAPARPRPRPPARRLLITTDPREILRNYSCAILRNSLTHHSPSQTIGATGFFVFSLVAEIMDAWAPSPIATGFTAKKAIAAANVIVLDAGLGIFKAPAWTTNACEWTLAFIVIAFHAALAADLSAKGARLTLVTTAAKAKGEAPLVAPLVAA